VQKYKSISYKWDFFCGAKLLRFFVFMKAANGYGWWSEVFAVSGSERKKERKKERKRETERFLATLGMTAFGPVEIREPRLN
jgi:hypothetical protein